MKMDWLELERKLRAELRNVKQARNMEQLIYSLMRISDHIGDETGRGYELDESFFLDYRSKK